MSVLSRDADENGLRLDLYLSSRSLFSGKVPSEERKSEQHEPCKIQ
jgi:hypothetical protein